MREYARSHGGNGSHGVTLLRARGKNLVHAICPVHSRSDELRRRESLCPSSCPKRWLFRTGSQLAIRPADERSATARCAPRTDVQFCRSPAPPPEIRRARSTVGAVRSASSADSTIFCFTDLRRSVSDYGRDGERAPPAAQQAGRLAS